MYTVRWLNTWFFVKLLELSEANNQANVLPYSREGAEC